MQIYVSIVFAWTFYLKSVFPSHLKNVSGSQKISGSRKQCDESNVPILGGWNMITISYSSLTLHPLVSISMCEHFSISEIKLHAFKDFFTLILCVCVFCLNVQMCTMCNASMDQQRAPDPQVRELTRLRAASLQNSVSKPWNAKVVLRLWSKPLRSELCLKH